MKKSLILAAFALVVSGCKKDPAYEEYKGKRDAITARHAEAAGDKLVAAWTKMYADGLEDCEQKLAAPEACEKLLQRNGLPLLKEEVKEIVQYDGFRELVDTLDR